MFGLFKSASYRDPQLGPFTRSRGMWRGSIGLPDHAPAPLVLSGNRTAPDPAALATARRLSVALASWRPAIEAALYDHYDPYADALASGDLPKTEASRPRLSASGQVWQHVLLRYVAVSPLDGRLTVELGYTVAWDQEHTLGARFQQGRLLELNGSVLPP